MSKPTTREGARKRRNPPTHSEKGKEEKKSRVARRLVIGQPRQQQGVGADAAGERAAWQARTWCSWRRALVARTSGWRRCFWACALASRPGRAWTSLGRPWTTCWWGKVTQRCSGVTWKMEHQRVPGSTGQVSFLLEVTSGQWTLEFPFPHWIKETTASRYRMLM